MPAEEQEDPKANAKSKPKPKTVKKPVQKNSKDNKLKSSKEKGKESKTKSKKKKEETKPVLKNESHDQKGMGAGDDYQTLGNLDRNIFIKGGSKGKKKIKILNKIFFLKMVAVQHLQQAVNSLC